MKQSERETLWMEISLLEGERYRARAWARAWKAKAKHLRQILALEYTRIDTAVRLVAEAREQLEVARRRLSVLEYEHEMARDVVANLDPFMERLADQVVRGDGIVFDSAAFKRTGLYAAWRAAVKLADEQRPPEQAASRPATE